MPVVKFDFEDFSELLGYEISKDELVKKIPMIGADLDKVEDNEISIEFFPNRPDLTSVEGIARAARSFFDFEKGMKEYPVKQSDIELKVDPSVKKVRPFIATGLVKNVTITDTLIKSLMELQEKLHFGIGRKRKKVAIGVHNYEPIQPPFVYKAVDPDEIQFVPLGKVESMTLSEILRKHEKGIEYAHILQKFDKHPIIMDSNNNVLSYPPIINGILTEVTPFTKELFIDVTGTDRKTVRTALNIVTTALAERNGKIYTTRVNDQDKTFLSPYLKPSKKTLSSQHVNQVLGTDFEKSIISECLWKMGYEVKNKNNKKMTVEIPAWRADILHEIDLIEDVAIGYGFDKFQHDFPKSSTLGNSLPNYKSNNTLRDIMIGLGFNEVTTFTITNEKDEYLNMGMEINEKRTQIENPIGEDYSCLRTTLIPSLMNILRENRQHNLPQQIFELGIVVDEKHENKFRLAAVKIDAKASFTEIKSIAEAIMRETGVKYDLKEKDHPAFINGRCASLIHKNEEIGYFGEIHPKTIKNFELSHPVIAMEMKTNKLQQKE